MRPEQKGFADREAALTLVEILVAMAILGIAAAALSTGMIGNTRINSEVDQKATAARILETEFEKYRQVNDFGSLQSGASTPNIVQSTTTVNGINYTVRATFCPTDLPTETKVAMPCSRTAVYIRLEVNNGPTTLQKAETYYTKFGRAD